MDASAFEQVYGAFGDFHAYFGPLFGRREARDYSRHYLQALLVQSGERRNAENLSETVPASARVMQRFLTESPWDDDAVIGRLQKKQERFPKSQILKGVLPFFGKCHPLRKTLSFSDKYSRASASLSHFPGTVCRK